MAIARPSSILRGAFSRGAGFGIARRLFRGFSIDNITKWLFGTFGNLVERELLALVEHGRQVRFAGDAFTALAPGEQLSLSQIPVNPYSSSSIYEGARVVSELILPWQIQGTDQAGEWYHRFRHIDVIGVDEITEDINTWIAGNVQQYVPTGVADFLDMTFNVGNFVGVGFERAY